MSTSAENPERLGKLSKQEREKFLTLPHIGVLSVRGDDDRPPLTVPTWYAYAPGGPLAIITRKGKRKSRLLRHAGKVSFAVQRAEVPYKYVTVEGTVIRQEYPTRDELLSIGRRYLPADEIDRWAEWELRGGNGDGEPEYVEIRPDRWLTADFAKASFQTWR